MGQGCPNILKCTGQSHNKELPGPKVNSAEAEKPGSRDSKVGRRMTENGAVTAGDGY